MTEKEFVLSIYDPLPVSESGNLVAAAWWTNFGEAALELCQGPHGIDSFFDAAAELAGEWNGRLAGTGMYFESESDLTLFLLRWS